MYGAATHYISALMIKELGDELVLPLCRSHANEHRYHFHGAITFHSRDTQSQECILSFFYFAFARANREKSTKLDAAADTHPPTHAHTRPIKYSNTHFYPQLELFSNWIFFFTVQLMSPRWRHIRAEH